MQTALIVFALVCFAAIAESKPALKDRLLSKLAKRAAEDDAQWPYEWIEFSNLVGKCEAVRIMFENMNLPVHEESLLAETCPHVWQAGEAMMDLDVEGPIFAEVADMIKAVYPVMQCANLQADREEVWFMSYLFRENMEENVYLRESKPLFDLCEHVFAHFEQEVEKDMDKAEDMMNNDNVTRKLSDLIRKLTRK